MWIKKFLFQIIVCVTGVILVGATPAYATNVPAPGGIGDYGNWMTPDNMETVGSEVRTDLGVFESNFENQLVDNYVPPEAKIGLAFINAMGYVGQILDRSLANFAMIFILVMFAFWTSLEAYQLITAQVKLKPTVYGIAKKSILIAVWLYILHAGPAEIFMWAMGPILSVSTYLSDLILNSITAVSGASLPDTCAAIHAYTAANISPNSIINADAAAEIMCVPTRLSPFFYTAVAAGFKWILSGLLSSPFTVCAGVIFVVMFVRNIWKFALMALGVIADLFLAIFLLPFTAIVETSKKTSYNGIAGMVYNGFLSLLSAENLGAQIGRFINAAIFFVSLAMVIGVDAALLAGVMHTDLSVDMPTVDTGGFVMVLLVGNLVAYLADKAMNIAKSLGGKIDDSLGQQFGRHVTILTNDSIQTAKKWWKLYKENK